LAEYGDPWRAEESYNKALSVARRQSAKPFELRVVTSLAWLWRDQGKVREARELLARVYGWLTEGFDTRDSKEAKALLEDFAVQHGNKPLPAWVVNRLLCPHPTVDAMKRRSRAALINGHGTPGKGERIEMLKTIERKTGGTSR
jgi:hypothetical protein